MKIRWESPTGAYVELNQPDERMTMYYIQQLRAAYEQELSDFLDEVKVTLRHLQPGEKKELASKPITVKLSRDLEEKP